MAGHVELAHARAAREHMWGRLRCCERQDGPTCAPELCWLSPGGVLRDVSPWVADIMAVSGSVSQDSSPWGAAWGWACVVRTEQWTKPQPVPREVPGRAGLGNIHSAAVPQRIHANATSRTTPCRDRSPQGTCSIKVRKQNPACPPMLYSYGRERRPATARAWAHIITGSLRNSN